MLRITNLRLPLNHDPQAFDRAVRQRLGLKDAQQLLSTTIFRRAYDARKKAAIELIYTLDCELKDPAIEARLLASNDSDLRPSPDTRYRLIASAPIDFALTHPRPVVVGFGPCGLFAALVLAQMGLKPLVLERGRAVRQRTKDTWRLWRQGVLDPASNVQFGEGGAGTFSDGKLWSQISDPRHLTRKVLQEFVKAGAPEEILYVSKPHIGTFRLVSMIEKMRAEIESLGGEIRFEQQLVDLQIEAGAVRGLRLASGEQIDATHVVLALGHSARDTFEMLHARGAQMQAKPFSVGFRIEHPQSLIDAARFGPNAGHPILGAADYKLVHHASNGRSVYSFCMCPGGTVVAATSEPERVVTNGMSQYSRAERNANAGIVVGISPQDYRQDGRHEGTVSPLDGMAFQRRWESRAYELGGGGYRAPAALVGDFIKRQTSTVLGEIEPSYKPGVTLTQSGSARPGGAARLCARRHPRGLPRFAGQIRGFDRPDAVLTGVETRTSSPLRVPRGKRLPKPQCARPVPGRRGRGVRGRHHVRRGRRHRGGRGAGALVAAIGLG
jgi:uncharacterized FAD-dependent dehydrogenase